MRFDYIATPPGRKTPRIRGRIVQFILAVAARRQTITWRDLQPLPHRRALRNLNHLPRQGRLTKVATGIRGRVTGCPAIFALRKTE